MTNPLKDEHRAAIVSALATNEKVNRVVLFGSRAKGTNSQTSDVDIALFGNRLTLTDVADLSAIIEGIPMAQSVDLILFDTISKERLRTHIKTEGIEWFRRTG